jgi:predicted solute-binding protein
MLMDNHTAFISLYSDGIVREISRRMGIPEDESLALFYESKTYRLYENEQTKLWHFSDVAIAEMVIRENETGVVTIPEAC